MITESLKEMKEYIVKYGNLVSSMIEKSVKGLIERDESLLKEVMEEDEPRANRMEIEIDEIVLSSLARFQPEAKDLRVILMVSKMNNDLERMGDLADNVADGAFILIERPEVKPLLDIPRMADNTKRMLNQVITAFIEEDALLAVEVLKHDDVVDNLRDQILRDMIAMMSDPKILERGLQIIRIVRNLERIADHTTNMAEDVIFIKEGKIVKHQSSQKKKIQS